MRRQPPDQPSNLGERPAADHLAEVHKRYGDRDDLLERLIYLGAYLVFIYLVYRVSDLRGVGAVLIITAVPVVMSFARSALVSILAIVLGLLGLVVYSHIVWRFL